MYSNKLIACIKVNDKVLREKGDDVFLPYGTEYSLWFKNEHSKKVKIFVEVDGQDVLYDKAIIIDANNSVELKGYVRDLMGDDNRAFKFIPKNEFISNFRGDRLEDGLVKITYQFEAETHIQTSLITRYTDNDFHWDISGLSHEIKDGQYDGSVSSTNHTLTSQNINSATRTITKSISQSPNNSGITVEGSNTNQSFKSGCIGRLESTKHTMIFKLNGLTSDEQIEEPITVEKKKQCSSCGKKWKSNFEYCPFDGTFLRF